MERARAVRDDVEHRFCVRRLVQRSRDDQRRLDHATARALAADQQVTHAEAALERATKRALRASEREALDSAKGRAAAEKALARVKSAKRRLQKLQVQCRDRHEEKMLSSKERDFTFMIIARVELYRLREVEGLPEWLAAGGRLRYKRVLKKFAPNTWRLVEADYLFPLPRVRRLMGAVTLPRPEPLSELVRKRVEDDIRADL